MKLHDLKPAEGSNRGRKRVGRGIAGKGGKTAGRGTKGQKARNTVAVAFEGGQLPLTQRLPKLKGFNNPFRVEYIAVNLDTVAAVAADGESTVDPSVLRARGLIAKKGLVKILGRGTLTGKVNVQAHAISSSAKQAIEAAGGTVEILPKPYGGPRPAAQGNQHMNR